MYSAIAIDGPASSNGRELPYDQSVPDLDMRDRDLPAAEGEEGGGGLNEKHARGQINLIVRKRKEK